MVRRVGASVFRCDGISRCNMRCKCSQLPVRGLAFFRICRIFLRFCLAFVFFNLFGALMRYRGWESVCLFGVFFALKPPRGGCSSSCGLWFDGHAPRGTSPYCGVALTEGAERTKRDIYEGGPLLRLLGAGTWESCFEGHAPRGARPSAKRRLRRCVDIGRRAD